MNPVHTWKKNSRDISHLELSHIHREKLQRVGQNLFRMYRECIHASGEHLQHLL